MGRSTLVALLVCMHATGHRPSHAMPQQPARLNVGGHVAHSVGQAVADVQQRFHAGGEVGVDERKLQVLALLRPRKRRGKCDSSMQ